MPHHPSGQLQWKDRQWQVLTRMWRDWNPHPLLVVYRIVQSLWNTVWQLLRTSNIESPYDRVMPLKGLHPRQRHTYVHAKPCIWMFTEALFAIAPKWKQPKCSSSLPLGASPEAGLLGHRVAPCLTFWGPAMLFSILAASFHIPTSNARGAVPSSCPTLVIFWVCCLCWFKEQPSWWAWA